MLHRAFRLPDGSWADVLFSTDADEFTVPAESNAADVADALGVAVGELECVEDDTDPRGEDRRPLPVPEPTVEQVRRDEFESLREAALTVVDGGSWPAGELERAVACLLLSVLDDE